MYGRVNRGWDLLTPGCGGTLPLSSEETLATHSVHERQTANRMSANGVRVPTHCGACVDPGFSPSVAGVGDVRDNYDLSMVPHHPRVRRDLDVVPKGTSRRVLA